MLNTNIADKYSISLIQTLEKLGLSYEIDLEKIKSAATFAKKYHEGQKRGTGEPYYSHPVRVAEMVAELCFKTDVIVAALLHDVVEDTEATVEIIEKEFGKRVAEIVEGLTRIKPSKKITSAELLNELYKHKDREAIIIKLCDRVHNAETIEAKSIDKQRKIVRETAITFVSFCMHLDIHLLKENLIRLCYRALNIEYTQEQLIHDEHVLSQVFQNAIFPK